MKIVHSDYESLKQFYNSIYEPKLKIKLVMKKYLLMLKSLENKYNMLDETNKAKVTLDNYITYFIGRKILEDLDVCIEKEDKQLEKETIILIKKEIERIKKYKDSIDINSNYSCMLTQDKVKEIMLEYMSEEEIKEELLKLYPKTLEELSLRNSIKEDSLTNKFKDGSIVRRKLITKI